MASLWADVQWEWILTLGGVGCAALCGLLGVALVGLLAWRMMKPAASTLSAPPTLPLDSPALLTGRLGYVRTGEYEYSRERWGRPLLHTCTLDEGDSWETDAVGRRICIREHSDTRSAPAGLTLHQTGDDALDLRFATYCDAAQDACLLADPELRNHLLSLPWLHVVADGHTVKMCDPQRRALSLLLDGLPTGTEEATPVKVSLHDTVGDVLVMLADRLS